MIIIVTFLIILVFVKIDKFLNNKENIQNNNINNLENKNIIHNNTTMSPPPSSSYEVNSYAKYYKPKYYITTLNELKFYNVLLEVAKELDLILFCQVSLYNIVSMREDLDYRTRETYFNKIASKSIDFVLVNKSNCRIRLCIELDDTTHKRRKRRERDAFINKLFRDLGINLLRYPIYNVYYKDSLKNKIEEIIQKDNTI